MNIRYSMLNAYITCPISFYETYILKKIQIERSSALEFGTALHLGLKTTLEGEDGAQAFEMYWNSLKDVHMQYYGDSWASLREVAMDSFLPNFKSRHLKKFGPEFEQEVGMEMPFSDLGTKAIVTDILTYELKHKHTLQGTADYIGKYEGLITIADWKTSSKEYKKTKIDHNYQLYIYAKLHQHKTGKLPEQIMYKVFNKKTGSIQTLKKQLTESNMDAIHGEVVNVAKAMLHAIETKELWHGPDCYCRGYDVKG